MFGGENDICWALVYPQGDQNDRKGYTGKTNGKMLNLTGFMCSSSDETEHLFRGEWKLCKYCL